MIARHGAQYLNVTEARWDGAVGRPRPSGPARDVALGDPERPAFFPSALLELLWLPMISFARFKGPTRLGLSNLFGLIPHPLRSEWHGRTSPTSPSVCCELARLYSLLFPPVRPGRGVRLGRALGSQRALSKPVGKLRSLLTDGLFTLSEGLVGADLLASRLQGQDVRAVASTTSSGTTRLVGAQRWYSRPISNRSWSNDIRLSITRPAAHC